MREGKGASPDHEVLLDEGHGTWTVDHVHGRVAVGTWKRVSVSAASAGATELLLVHDGFWNCMGCTYISQRDGIMDGWPRPSQHL